MPNSAAGRSVVPTGRHPPPSGRYDPPDTQKLASDSYKPPSAQWCRDNAERIRWSLTQVQASLQRPTGDEIDVLIGTMIATATLYSREDPEVWAVRRAEYKRLFGHFPVTCWQHAIDQHRRQSNGWPGTKDMQVLLDAKKRELDVAAHRLERMLRRQEEPPPTKGQRLDELSPEQKAQTEAMLKETFAHLAGGMGGPVD